MKLRTVIILLGVVLALGVSTAYVMRGSIREWLDSRSKEEVPRALNRTDVVLGNDNENENDNVNSDPNINVGRPRKILFPSINLQLPFTTQAPNANWDKDHEEFCEEASVLMVARYWQDRGIQDAADAEDALQQLKTWEVENLGLFESTTAEQTARMLREFYGFQDVIVVKSPTVDDIKQNISDGFPVIIPAAGRELNNPNFKQPGPLYHMLVVKGYTTDGKFVTNDPGTRKGADYVYSESVLMNAIHDWNAGDVMNGEKTVIVVRSK